MDSPQQQQPQEADRSGSQQSSGRRGFCCGCLVATIVLTCAFVIILIMLFSSPGEVIAQGRRALAPQDSVEQATMQISEAQMQAVRGVRPTVQIQLTDADVNAYLEEHRQEMALPPGLKKPKVAFGEGYIEASVRTRVAFVPVRARVRLRPEVVDGKLVLHVSKLKAGKLGLPAHFRKQLESRLGDMISQRLVGTGVTLRDVQVHPGQLSITATIQPQ